MGLRKEQAGFRHNRSCIDQISTLRVIIEQSVAFQSPLYMLFVDYQRASDSLGRAWIWDELKARGLPSKLLNIIKEGRLKNSWRRSVIKEAGMKWGSWHLIEVEKTHRQPMLLEGTMDLIIIIINSVNSNTNTRLQQYDWGTSMQLQAGAQSAPGSHPHVCPVGTGDSYTRA